MGNDLLRVESAVTATASGNLTWEKWTHDCAVALGLAGLRNPLGFAIVRYRGDEPPSVANARDVVLKLAKEMERRDVPADRSLYEMAMQAFEFWRDPHCPRCGGRGVLNIDQHQCPVCAGTGQRQMPAGPDAVRTGIAAMVEAESWMDGQLGARLKGMSYQPPAEGHKVNLPSRGVADDMGFERSPLTPKRKGEDHGG